MARFRRRFGRVGLFWYLVAKWYARLTGWKIIGELPKEKKCIGIIAPHTSNWDVFFCYVIANNFRIKSNWLAKHTLLRPPLGWLLRPLGALPVDRSAPHGVVGECVRILGEMDAVYLAIAPEGTRHKTDHWKTGFYQISEQSGVPYVCMIIDYGKKECGFGPVLYPTGDMEADFQRVWDVYRDVTPLHPKNRSEMRLKHLPRARAAEASQAEKVSP